jgi:hypothetical protein
MPSSQQYGGLVDTLHGSIGTSRDPAAKEKALDLASPIELKEDPHRFLRLQGASPGIPARPQGTIFTIIDTDIGKKGFE